MATSWTLRRGFWRLTLLVWLAGAAFLVWLSEEPFLSPFTNACTTADAAAYDECRRDAPPTERGRLARLLDTFRTPPAAIDETRSVPRWTATRYRAALRTLAVREAWWAAIVWVPFYLLVWAFAGFRPRAAPGDPGRR